MLHQRLTSSRASLGATARMARMRALKKMMIKSMMSTVTRAWKMMARSRKVMDRMMARSRTVMARKLMTRKVMTSRTLQMKMKMKMRARSRSSLEGVGL